MSFWDDLLKNAGHAIGIGNTPQKPAVTPPSNTLRQQAVKVSAPAQNTVMNQAQRQNTVDSGPSKYVTPFHYNAQQKADEAKVSAAQWQNSPLKPVVETIGAPYESLGKGLAYATGGIKSISDESNAISKATDNTLKLYTNGSINHDQLTATLQQLNARRQANLTSANDAVKQTDPVRQAGNVINAGLDIATLPVGGTLLKTGAEVAAKTAATGAKSLIVPTVEATTLGAGYGASGTMQSEGTNLKPLDLATNTAVGAGIGAATGLAAPLVGKVIKTIAAKRAAGVALTTEEANAEKIIAEEAAKEGRPPVTEQPAAPTFEPLPKPEKPDLPPITSDAVGAIASGDNEATAAAIHSANLTKDEEKALIDSISAAHGDAAKTEAALNQFGIPTETPEQTAARQAAQAEQVQQQAQAQYAEAPQEVVPTEPTPAPQASQAPATAPAADVAQNDTAFAGTPEATARPAAAESIATPAVTAPVPPTLKSYGKEIPMTEENGYHAQPTADGGVIYQKVAKQGTYKKGDSQLVNTYYDAQGNKLTPAQAKAMAEGKIASTPHTAHPDAAAQVEKPTIEDARAALNDGHPTPEQEQVLKDTLGEPNPQDAVKRATTPPPTAAEQLYDSSSKEVPNQTYQRIIADPNIKGSTKKLVDNAFHGQQNQDALAKAGSQLVKEDAESAQRLFDSNDLRTANPAAHTHLGNALVDHYNKLDQPDEAGKIYDAMIEHSSQGGQATNAAKSISKISPQGIVGYAQKIADKQGKSLAPEVVKSLQDAAKNIVKMADGPEKESAIKDMLAIARNEGPWKKVQNAIEGVLSLPRTILSTADLSFVGRQGAVLAAGHPVQGAKAFAKSIAYAFNPKYFAKSMEAVVNSTDKNGAALYPLYKKMGLGLEAAGGHSEEVFGNTGLLESKVAKYAGVGHVVAGSDRAFSGAATELRANVARNIINSYGGVAEVAKWDSKALKDLGRVIDTASGRGHGGKWFEDAAPTLGKTLFSARLWKSRLDLINPVYYATLSGAARKEAARSMGAFLGVAGTVLAAAKASGAEVEMDPRSSDFGKIKIGDTRYDILGGLQQNVVLMAREITGQTKSTTTGEVTPLDGKSGHKNRLDVAANFVDNKLSPVLGAIIDLARGTDQGGNPVTVGSEAANLVTPMNVQDVTNDMQATGDNAVTAAAKSVPGIFGVGINTYSSSRVGPAKSAADISAMTPDEQAAYISNTKKDFGSTLSKDDKAKYRLLGQSANVRNLQIQEGKVTQDQLDTLKSQENRYLQSHNLPIDTGYSADDFSKFSPAAQSYITDKALNGPTQDKTKTSDAAKQVYNEATSGDNLWPGVDASAIKPTNNLADQWVKYQKAITAAGDDQAAQFDAQKTFWSAAVKQGYDSKIVGLYDAGSSTNEKNTYSMSVKNIEQLGTAEGIKVGNKSYHINKQDLDHMVDLDNKLLSAGLIASPKFSKTVREAYGYAAPPESTLEGVGYHPTSGSSSSTKSGKTYGDQFLTNFGSGSGGNELKLNAAGKPSAAPKLDIAKYQNRSGVAGKSSVKIKL